MNPAVTMSSSMLMPFLPMLVVSLTVIVAMIAIAVKRSNLVTGTISVVGLNIALLVLIAQMRGHLAPYQGFISSLFVVDTFAQVNMLIILVCALACFTLTYGYIQGYMDKKEEIYLLMLTSTLGAMLMVCSDHFAAFFVSLELLSVPMYGMLAYTYARGNSLEAGLKYLVLSATASATMLMGMALVYATTGSLGFRPIGMSVGTNLQQAISQPTLVVGAALMLFGIAFKLSAAPFHTWTPDVYQGAPAPVATFLGSVAKVATMALGLRFLITTNVFATASVDMVLVVIASLSILVGNILALRQQNVKRMLAYSSIAHIGYVLAVVSSVGINALGYATMYMAVYAFTTIGAFGVITIMSSPYQRQGEAEYLDNYKGLFWQRPVLTAVMTVMLLSLAGVPLTAGFITKFFAMFATVSAQRWWLAAMIILGSAISLYYYLHFMVNMFKRPQTVKPYDAVNHWGIQAGGIMVLLVTAAVLYFGIFPEWIAKLIALIRIG